MMRLRSLRSLLPVLALLFALAGIASARAGTERVASPAGFALCLGAEQPDGGHDCLDCCLPQAGATSAAVPLPMLWSRLAVMLRLESADFALNGFGLPQPLSRGPPVQPAA
jgi:hypothetical protein